MRTDTAASPSPAPAPRRLADYRPTDYAVDRVEMTFRLHPTATRVTTVLHCRRREGAAPDAPLVLDGDGLRLASIALDGEPLDSAPVDSAPLDAVRYEATPDRLTLRDPPAAFALGCETVIDPTANTALVGLYRSGGAYCTQCEAEGFRRIAYMLDRPDVLSVYTVRIEAPDGEPVLLSNGEPTGGGDLPDGGRWAEWHDPHPKPPYLFALVAGDLGRIGRPFTTMEGRDVALDVWVEHGKEARAEWAMDSLIRSMKWDEERWGRAYDLSVFNLVAVPDFNFGAMENKGLNVFNDALVLADPELATDGDYARIEAVVAHEYFHNWTGNRITCRDWFQLCLKEGLTVYRDHAFQSDMRDPAVRRIDEVRTLRAIQFPEDGGPLRHPVRPSEVAAIDNFYTATVYEKGSELVRMVRLLVGADAFRRGMDLYFERHDGQACTVEQFLACHAEVGGLDAARFMRWYEQPGTPVLRAAVRTEGDDLVVDLAQSQPPAPGASPSPSPDGTTAEPPIKPLILPLALELVGAGATGDWIAEDGATIRRPDGEPLAVMTGRTARLVARGGAGGASVLLAGFSAPVELEGIDSAARLAVAGGARDPVARWDALQGVLLDALVARARGDASAGAGDAEEDADEEADEDAALDALGSILADEALSPAFRAEALSLPSEAAVARALRSDVDPDRVHAAREAMIGRLAAAHAAMLADLHARMAVREPYRPDAEQSGRRALRAAALDILARAEGPERATGQFGRATDMTERFAALSTLVRVHGDADATAGALAAFEARYRDHPLAMDKWLAVQASRPGGAALDAALGLEGHATYDAANPNRVRALWGTFAANPTGFHRADGRGYAALRDRLATIDRANPMVAARLATAFRTWTQLETARRDAARNALTDLRDRGGLSPDLDDIVRRTLG